MVYKAWYSVNPATQLLPLIPRSPFSLAAAGRRGAPRVSTGATGAGNGEAIHCSDSDLQRHTVPSMEAGCVLVWKGLDGKPTGSIVPEISDYSATIACGPSHFLVCTDLGSLLSWGSNEHK